MMQADAKRPHLIIVIGIPGAGKTYFAEHFSDFFKAPLVSVDKLASGLEISTNKLKSLTLKVLDEILKTSQTIVLDGMADTSVNRLDITKLAKRAGYKPLLVWVQTDIATASKRKSKKLASADFDKRIKNFVKPLPNDDIVVVSGKHNFATQRKIILKYLTKPTAGITKLSR